MERPLEQLADFFLEESPAAGIQRVQFAVMDVGTDEVVGQTGFSRVRHDTRYGCLGPVIVAPSLRGQGIATWTINETVRFGFESLRLHRIELFVFDFNQHAIACYERVGFRQEGLHRDVALVDGTWWNWITMSVLEDEWSPIR